MTNITLCFYSNYYRIIFRELDNFLENLILFDKYYLFISILFITFFF